MTTDGLGTGPEDGVAVKGARNRDWEDLASDGEYLYIADLGNNLNKRRDLGFYQVPEPGLKDSETAEASFIPVYYSDQQAFPPLWGPWPYDCEAAFVFEDKLYVLTKERPGPGRLWCQAESTRLYRLDTRDTEKPNALILVDQKENMGGWVTAADCSPDGSRIAVLVESPVSSIWLFERPAQGDRFLSQGKAKRFIFHGAGPLEAICFLDPETLLFTSEKRSVFRVKIFSGLFQDVDLE